MIDPVQNVLSKANEQLARGVNLTESRLGNSTEAFAPKRIEVPNLPHEHSSAPYSIARTARRGGIVSGTE